MFYYKIIENFLTLKECDELLNFSLQNLELKNSEVKNYLGKTTTNTNQRKSKNAFFNYYKNFPFLHERLVNFLEKEIKINGFNLNFYSEVFQFTKYSKGDYFDWHKDSLNIENYNELGRYCSLVIQLNDSYTSGNLEIKDQDGSTTIVNKGIGNLIVFLSNIEHRVTPIEDGDRYTLVNWIGLKKIENLKKSLL